MVDGDNGIIVALLLFVEVSARESAKATSGAVVRYAPSRRFWGEAIYFQSVDDGQDPNIIYLAGWASSSPLLLITHGIGAHSGQRPHHI